MTNPHHWSFYTKTRPALHEALTRAKADQQRKMSVFIADTLEAALRAKHPELFLKPAGPITKASTKK